MGTGDRIKELRLSKNLTQEELGEKIGVKKAAIQKYENGTVENLKRSTIQNLANALGVSPLYILDFESDIRKDESEFKAVNESEREVLLLCRKVNNAPIEDRREILNQFKSSIGLYLKAKGLTEEED